MCRRAHAKNDWMNLNIILYCMFVTHGARRTCVLIYTWRIFVQRTALLRTTYIVRTAANVHKVCSRDRMKNCIYFRLAFFVDLCTDANLCTCVRDVIALVFISAVSWPFSYSFFCWSRFFFHSTEICIRWNSMVFHHCIWIERREASAVDRNPHKTFSSLSPLMAITQNDENQNKNKKVNRIDMKINNEWAASRAKNLNHH